MRRRWLLILVGTVVVIGVATVLFVAMFVPRGPFRFLAAHDPINVNLSTPMPPGHAYYSIQASYADFTRQADRDLGPARFYTRRNDGQRRMTCEFRRGLGPDVEYVFIVGDCRWAPNKVPYNGVNVLDAPGWVAVNVARRPEPGLWDRIKAMFGL